MQCHTLHLRVLCVQCATNATFTLQREKPQKTTCELGRPLFNWPWQKQIQLNVGRYQKKTCRLGGAQLCRVKLPMTTQPHVFELLFPLIV